MTAEFCLYFLTDEAYTASKTFILFFVLHCVWPSLLHLVVGEVIALWIESKTTAASIGALSTSCKIRHTVLMTHKYHFEAIVGPGVKTCTGMVSVSKRMTLNTRECLKWLHVKMLHP
ncbi:hypothetical protein VNO77_27054 [Canavalia gladiata]|uniref:Uncharacterized protein n=1 Tax=Canavalia gladiata TaxID=3824 RepID=A0AAN9KTZ7_CANGL